MILDTSAVIAIALREKGWETIYQQAIQAPKLLISSGTLQELLIVACHKGILAEVRSLLNYLDLDYVAVDHDLALKAVEIYQRYGQAGNHPAQLNYADCFAVALSEVHQIPLLYAKQHFSDVQN
ncbi:PilT protein domain protein [Halothece sp. PCC 7418]|uniref:type II toxin-antitoxin system VapC family toxin n=1 Tax=Halothece sp. (strain PCC 7418) TaxID=65093 RepID=UPI0002A0609F|nr:type II toxin-antitoxin system VapC family toxin [Halothece sp. PCC 7418]AFZ42529.1 PilT protein domain protein [Halothece sp. PCC 7418]